jgi:hypothetical protein
LILLVGIVATFGAFVTNRKSATNAITSVLTPPPPPGNYNASAPAKEYVYSSRKLVAVSEKPEPIPTDLAVWRPSNGVWFVMAGSATGSYSYNYAAGWGLNGDKPVPGDYS